MPDVPSFLTDYHIELEWLLTVYPITESIHLKQPMMRGDHAFHNIADFGPTSVTYHTSQIDILNTNGFAGFIGIRINQNNHFLIDLEVQGGSIKRKKSFVVLPGAAIPFMVNLVIRGEEYLPDAALVYQGVCTAGERVNLLKTGAVAVRNVVGNILKGSK